MKHLLLILITSLITSSFTAKRVTWTALGDSITYLNEHPKETRNRITKGYMTRVVEKLPQISYINKGYNGWTASRVAGEINNLGIMSSDVYTIFLGTNDWWSEVPLGTWNDYVENTGNGTFYGSYKIIVNKLHNLNKSAKIVLITPMQRGDFIYIADKKNNAWGSYKLKNGQSLAAFAEAIGIIGKHEKMRVVDLYNHSGITLDNVVKFKRVKDESTAQYVNLTYPEYIEKPFNPYTDEYPYPPEAVEMTYDGLHPSDQGYEIIAGMLVQVFKKIKLN
ncbi:SGNH/GDSL hydrolase family protein [Flavobacterium sp.]|uniref:SGNH/GDSL hydrolase family protein n=1 Tax=Flavobacterium sp. TaxID=239 RepID=UPI00286DC2C9|nr:SGNH/GDSL hydrolase family protein [Flavobacterium sp.]